MILFSKEEKAIARPHCKLKFNVWVSKIIPSDKGWLISFSSRRSELIDMIKDDTIRSIPLIVCINRSFVKMKLRKKMNDKRLFPAFYRTRKTQFGKKDKKLSPEVLQDFRAYQ